MTSKPSSTFRVKQKVVLLGWRRARHAQKARRPQWEQANYWLPTQGWCNVSYYLDVLGRVNSANIYEGPTSFNELPSYCGGYKDESDLVLPSRGSQWCKNPEVIFLVYAVLMRPLLKNCIRFRPPPFPFNVDKLETAQREGTQNRLHEEAAVETHFLSPNTWKALGERTE